MRNDKPEIQGLPSSLYTSIVHTLKEYNRPLPVEYLAKVVGLRLSQLSLALDSLKEENIIRLQGDEVSLMPDAEQGLGTGAAGGRSAGAL